VGTQRGVGQNQEKREWVLGEIGIISTYLGGVVGGNPVPVLSPVGREL